MYEWNNSPVFDIVPSLILSSRPVSGNNCSLYIWLKKSTAGSTRPIPREIIAGGSTVSWNTLKDEKERFQIATNLSYETVQNFEFHIEGLQRKLRKEIEESLVNASNQVSPSVRPRDGALLTLFRNIRRVIVLPGETESVWVVEFYSPRDSSVDGPQCFRFSSSQIDDKSPDSFMREYRDVFQTDINLSEEDWRIVRYSWIKRASYLHSNIEMLTPLPPEDEMHEVSPQTP